MNDAQQSDDIINGDVYVPPTRSPTDKPSPQALADELKQRLVSPFLSSEETKSVAELLNELDSGMFAGDTQQAIMQAFSVVHTAIERIKKCLETERCPSSPNTPIEECQKCQLGSEWNHAMNPYDGYVVAMQEQIRVLELLKQEIKAHLPKP